jgi:hypothetical protein
MNRAVAAAAFASTLLLAPAAQAVIVHQGEIEADGVVSTLDLVFFSLPVAAEALAGVSPLSVGPPLTGFENPQLLLYANDGSLDAANFIAGADDTIGLTPQLAVNLPAGDYVFVIGASDIAVGQFGPTQANALPTPGFVYELGISRAAGNEGMLTCVLDGRLDGGFSRRVFGVDNCVVPTPATEPASLGLLALGLAGLAASLVPRSSARRRLSLRRS